MHETTTPTQEARNVAAGMLALELGHLDDGESLDPETFDDCSYEAGAATLLVLTDDEADERARESIREMAWAFQADFLVDFVPDGILAEHIDTLRGDSCEDFNEPLLALIEAGPTTEDGQGFERFWRAAVSADGRGPFLAGYDHEEIEHGAWYAYRTN